MNDPRQVALQKAKDLKNTIGATKLEKLMENTEETEKVQAEKTEKTNTTETELEKKTAPKRNWSAAAAEHHRRTAMRHSAGPKWRARGPRGKNPTSPASFEDEK